MQRGFAFGCMALAGAQRSREKVRHLQPETDVACPDCKTVTVSNRILTECVRRLFLLLICRVNVSLELLQARVTR